MLSFIKLSRRFDFFLNFLLDNRKHLIIAERSFTSYFKIRLCNTPFNFNIAASNPCKMMILRGKFSGKKRTYETKEEEEDDDEETQSDEKDDQDFHFKGDVIKTYETQTPRVDKLLKVCFKISRKSIEDIFYQTKVRVNGRILKKKSTNAKIGDEIDIINDFVHENHKLISVNRIEILHIKEHLENLKCSIKVKKLNSLIIQNYNGTDEWKG